MGFKRPVTNYKLLFDGTEYDGLEIVVSALSVGEMQEITRKSASVFASGVPTVLGQVDTSDELLEKFANCIVSWNLVEEDDTPIVPSVESVKAQEAPFITAIVNAWMSATAGVTPDLGKDSDSGETFPEALIPMDT